LFFTPTWTYRELGLSGRIVRGVIQDDSRPRDFIPRLVDLFMAGRMPLDRLITRYASPNLSRWRSGSPTRSR
jgi:aryl-alcohol dehydrogenase